MCGNRIISLLFLFVNLFAPSISLARNYYISPAGDDSKPGTSPDQTWRTLKRASAAEFASGDSIFLERGGVWHESFAITTDGLTLAAYGKGDRPVIDAGQGSAEIAAQDCCLQIKASRITIRSIMFCHAARADRGAISVWADHNLHDITIEDCQISDNHGRGIWICGPAANSIRDVSIENNQFLRNDSCGLLMTLAENSEVRGNQFVENCRKPIEPWQAAIRVWSDGIRNLDISKNIIRDQRWHLGNDSAMGIHCDETGSVTIRENLVRNVDHAGIEIENTRGVTAERNAIVDANIGIFIDRAGHDHVVRDNAIVDSRSFGIFLHAWRTGGVDAGPEIEVEGKLLTHNLIEGNSCFGSGVAELGVPDDGVITAGPLGNIYRDNDFGPERAGFIEWGAESFGRYADWVAVLGAGTKGNKR